MEAKEHTIRTCTVEETQRVAALLARQMVPGAVIALDGDLGAGKTHFVQGFAQGLGVKDAVTSPTFNVMSVYPEGRLPLYHFDLYRLEDALELEDVAFYDHIESDGVSCIEWASKFADEIPDSALWLSITVSEGGMRCITASTNDAQTKGLIDAWMALMA